MHRCYHRPPPLLPPHLQRDGPAHGQEVRRSLLPLGASGEQGRGVAHDCRRLRQRDTAPRSDDEGQVAQVARLREHGRGRASPEQRAQGGRELVDVRVRWERRGGGDERAEGGRGAGRSRSEGRGGVQHGRSLARKSRRGAGSCCHDGPNKSGRPAFPLTWSIHMTASGPSHGRHA